MWSGPTRHCHRLASSAIISANFPERPCLFPYYPPEKHRKANLRSSSVSITRAAHSRRSPIGRLASPRSPINCALGSQPPNPPTPSAPSCPVARDPPSPPQRGEAPPPPPQHRPPPPSTPPVGTPQSPPPSLSIRSVSPV
jgi:hypothetical protein